MTEHSSGEGDELWSDRTHPVREDMAFQRGTWWFERAGWCLLGLVILAALLGFFAAGPFSPRTAVDPQARMTVEYERFLRNGDTSRLLLRVERTVGDRLVLRLGGDFPASFTIEALQPEPLESSSGTQGLELTFAAPSEGPLLVHLTLRAEGFGAIRNDFASAGGLPIRFTQFIYP